jgi:hypothetical protein
MPDTRYQIPDTGYRMDVWYFLTSFLRQMLDAGYRMLDTGYQIPDASCRINVRCFSDFFFKTDSGCWIPDTRCQMPDAGWIYGFF